MASFKFHTNPFTSAVGQRIERATDSNLPSEDWALFIEICDIINDTEDGAKDAVKAIKKRLSNRKDYKSLMYTLTLLESCVKNCGHRFHVMIANKDVLGDLTKIIAPASKSGTSQVPQIVEEKILMLVQSWSDAFRNSDSLQAFVQCHEHLKAQGHEFPAQDIDTLAPIHTPKRTIPETEQPRPQSRPQTATTPQPQGFQQPLQRANSGPVNPSPAQLSKLRNDLNMVEENVRVMSEMLTAVSPDDEGSEDVNLLKELNSTCRQMQQRVIELLQRIANDEVTGELLRINDALNNVFIRYDRFEKNKSGVSSPAATTEMQNEQAMDSFNAALSALPTSQATNGTDPNLLIDFGAEPASTTASSTKYQEDDEFDMFAQTRNSTFADSRRAGSTYEDNTTNVPTESFAGAISSKSPYASEPAKTEDQAIEDEIQDVQEWLKDTDLNQLNPTQPLPQAASAPENEVPSGEQTSITSDEFDKFLAERSFVGPQRIESTRTTPGAPRQMQNLAGENQEEPMFAL